MCVCVCACACVCVCVCVCGAGEYLKQKAKYDTSALCQTQEAWFEEFTFQIPVSFEVGVRADFRCLDLQWCRVHLGHQVP